LRLSFSYSGKKRKSDDCNQESKKPNKKHRRKPEKILERKLQRSQRVHLLEIIVPETNLERASLDQSLDWTTFSHSISLKALNQRSYALFLKSALSGSQMLLDTLLNSTEKLFADFPPHQEKKCRGFLAAHHFGHHRCYVKEIRKWSGTDSPFFRFWKTSNQKLFDEINLLFSHHFESLSKAMIERTENENLFGSFASCAVSIHDGLRKHIDSKDFRHGMCAILFFGRRYTPESFFQLPSLSSYFLFLYFLKLLHFSLPISYSF